MIAGNLGKLGKAILPPALRRILTTYAPSLQAVAAYSDGTHELEGRKVFVIVSSVQTEPIAHRRTEFHRANIDIQIVPKGSEWIGIGPFDWTAPDIPAEKPDVYYLDKAVTSNYLRLSPGDFAIFYPEEPHQALCAMDLPAPLRKATFKIHQEVLHGY